MIHYGMISEVQDTKARVDIGGVTTDFLPVFQIASDFKQTWTPVRVKEQCIILAPFNDLNSGCILRGLYYSAYEPPSTESTKDVTRYSDGTEISYDMENKKLEISADGIVIDVKCSDVNINAASVNLTAENVKVDAQKIDLGSGGGGVVTNQCSCFFTGGMHMGSAKVTAIK